MSANLEDATATKAVDFKIEQKPDGDIAVSVTRLASLAYVETNSPQIFVPDPTEAYFPFYVLDGMLEVYTAGLHMWEVPKEPVLVLLEDEPHEVAQAA